MWFNIVILAVQNGVLELAFLIAVTAPILFNRNWMFIQRDAARHRAAQPTMYDDLPTEVQLADNSWHYAFQDFAVQFYTLFLAWVALLYRGLAVYFNIVDKQSWPAFMAVVDTMHWSMVWFSRAIWPALIFLFFLGLYLLFAGTCSKINIVAKYRYTRPPEIFGFHVPPLNSPLTIGRLVIALVALLFSLWREIVHAVEGLVI